ncbi:MAG: fibronectin type III domain-containing protein [Saprospiraceae bacterium]|nr:fibronectin type III domain-containing protein [Saprospiraceae bacterium]
MKRILLVMLVSMLPSFAYLQPWGKNYGDGLNFDQLVSRFEDYWSDKKPEKGKGYKPFRRWQHYWEPRLLEDRTFPEANKTLSAFQDFLTNYRGPRGAGRFQPANFSSLGPSSTSGGYAGTGRINSLAFHPTNTNIIYAGTAGGGLWQSNDGGTTWFTNTDQLATLGVSSIIVHPNSPERIYIATGDGDGSDNFSIGVLVSVDGGATFTPTGLSWNTSDTDLIRKLIFDPSNLDAIMAATSIGIYRSLDKGGTWTLVQAGDFDDIEANPTLNSNIFYASAQGNIYKSSNGGASWTLKQTIAGTNRIALGVSPHNAAYVYALCSKSSNSGYNGLYRSTDSGESYLSSSLTPNLLGWSATGSDSGGQGGYDLVLAVDPLNADIVYTGGVNTWKSTNGGVNWTINTMWYGVNGIPEVHADKHALEWQNNTTLWQGNDGGVYKTTNGGATWQHRGSGIVNSQMYKLGISQTDGKVMTGLQDNGSKLKETGGSWSDVIGGDGMECAIQHNDGQVLYGSIYNGDFNRSTNGGASWQNISDNVPGAPSGAWITPFEIDPGMPTTIYAGYQQVYKSEDQGSTWTSIGNFSANSLNILKVAPSNNKVIYAARSNGNLWRTTNGGTAWTQMTSPGNNLAFIAIHPHDANTLWAVRQNYTSGAKVYKSVNGGSSWVNISGTLPNIPANCIEYQNGSDDGLYVGMDVGIYYRDNTLSDWVLFNVGLPNVEVTELEIDYDENKIYAATYGRGLWASDLYNPITCFMPKAVSVVNLWNVSMTLQWQVPASAPAQGYEWGVNTTNQVPVTTQTTTNTSANITGLLPETDYYLFVRSVCTGNQQSPWVRFGPVTTLEQCPKVISVSQEEIGPTKATFSWFVITPPSVGYEYAVTSTETPPSSGIATTQNSAPLSGLTAATDYFLHVRSNCGVDGFSSWLTHPFQTSYTCGAVYYDSGGASQDYSDNEDRVQSICPTSPGYMASLQLTSIGIEEDWDALYVHNGDSVEDGLFASANGVTQAGYPAGGYYGFTAPPTFVSTHPSGCLTTHFLSDGGVTELGWVGNITCVNVCSNVVVNTQDDGPGSLRFALNCNPAGSQILFNILLTGDTIEVLSPMEISNNFQIINTFNDAVVIKATAAGPIFKINSGATVNLEKLKLLSGLGNEGRAIDNAGTLNLKNIDVIDHAGSNGGSTVKNTGALIIEGSTGIKE